MSRKTKFIDFLKIFLLIILCIAASMLIVFPLWKFSISLPKVYTITVLTLTFAAIIYLIIKKIISKKNDKN